MIFDVLWPLWPSNFRFLGAVAALPRNAIRLRRGSRRPRRQWNCLQRGGEWYIYIYMHKMVRSTLLHLPPRGALRANFGGPPVRLFFRLQTQVLTIKKGSGNKSSTLDLVSNHEKSDGDHHFLQSAREISKHDQLWGRFLGHYDRKDGKKHQEPSGMHPNDFQSIFKLILMIIFN